MEKMKLLIPSMFILFSSVSLAQMSGSPTFQDLDANTDGVLSQEEVVQVIGDFTQADTNGDGSLNQEEYDLAREAQSATEPEAGSVQ